ncbi:MAG: hypothetical protein K0S46_2197 [Moraxellaceae bacterium]|jgi:hypothetical protein|nr:hypothetical protein [Moraxellaceae bacterium]
MMAGILRRRPLVLGLGQAVMTQQGGAAPPVSCAYPLNASEAEILLLNGLGYTATGRLVLSNADQTGSYTVEGERVSAGAHWAFAANSTAGTGAKIDLASGMHAVEVVLTAPAFVAGSDPVWITGIVASAALAVQVEVMLQALDGGTYALYLKDGGGNIYSDLAFATNTALVTLEFDADEGTFAARVNGSAPVALARSAYTPGQCLLVLNSYEQPGILAGNAGKVFTGTWRAAAADIVGPVSVGMTDPCGNAI